MLVFAAAVQPDYTQLMQDEIDLDGFVIMPETLLYKIMKGESDYVLVDVRSVEEFRAGHVVGAVNLPLNDGTFMEKRGELPRSKEVIFISSDGLDALKALRILRDDDYNGNYNSLREMSSIEGGMGNWPYNDYLTQD
jgi:rhodanese-related sulfurtransferase